MPTRRTMIKIIFGAGALLLPWTPFTGILRQALLREARVRQQVPDSPAGAAGKSAVNKEEEFQNSTKRTAVLQDVVALAAPDMEGRRAGTAGEVKAAAYLTAAMQALRLKPLAGTTYVQAFTVPPMVERYVGGRLTFQAAGNAGLRAPSANLLGVLPGERNDEFILLSAHYDHLGVFAGELYPGANDNASGVACILQVVRRLLEEKATLQRTLIIAFWSGEEMGFLGSKAFVQNPLVPLAEIKAVFNVDTVGNGPEGNFALWGNEASVAVKALQAAAESLGATVPLVASGGHNSDQVSFTQVGIPAATLMSKAWLENNHTVKDTADFVQEEQILLAAEIVYQAVLKLGQ